MSDDSTVPDWITIDHSAQTLLVDPTYEQVSNNQVNIDVTWTPTEGREAVEIIQALSITVECQIEQFKYTGDSDQLTPISYTVYSDLSTYDYSFLQDMYE